MEADRYLFITDANRTVAKWLVEHLRRKDYISHAEPHPLGRRHDLLPLRRTVANPTPQEQTPSQQ
ncbi:MAG: hypothetical protein ACUVXA_01490 [Candidatus Jordarchaeum sp.]|uniref:hypothetical protein n=1 Tax=Candidatus Jordarchaeum sp. TaxID=2823881 RepID=UPI004049BD9A